MPIPRSGDNRRKKKKEVNLLSQYGINPTIK